MPYNKLITYLAILGNIGRTATTSDRYYVLIDRRGALEGKPLLESQIFSHPTRPHSVNKRLVI